MHDTPRTRHTDPEALRLNGGTVVSAGGAVKGGSATTAARGLEGGISNAWNSRSRLGCPALWPARHIARDSARPSSGRQSHPLGGDLHNAQEVGHDPVQIKIFWRVDPGHAIPPQRPCILGRDDATDNHW